MTAYRFVTITCDGCGEISDGGCDKTISAARSTAEGDGWHFRSGKDYCPRHYGYWWSESTGWVYAPSISIGHALRSGYPYFLPA